jgi:hypothetical protein
MNAPTPPLSLLTDRRTAIAALMMAALAPSWQHRLTAETQVEAARRLAECALTLTDALLAAGSSGGPTQPPSDLP